MIFHRIIKNDLSLLKTYNNKAGINSFFVLYFVGCREQFKKSLRFSAILTLILILLYFFSPVNGYTILLSLSNICLAVSPAILGFTLAGYSIIINVADKEILALLKRTKLKNDISMYQRLYTTFVAMLLSMFCTLLIGSVTKLLISLNLGCTCTCEFFIIIIDIVNGIWFALETFLLLYSIFSVKDLISNLYSLGQVSKNK